MRIQLNASVLELVEGDITDQQVDAIVNAANRHLAGGGGVDGAIHRRGGPSIMAETNARYPEGCPTGSAVSTAAGNLPAKFVFHAVGPYWSGGDQNEPELLASAYRSCLELAEQNECQSIAFPALSAGAYRYPLRAAAKVALTTTADWMRGHERPAQIRFVLFGAQTHEVFVDVANSVLPSAD